LNNQEISLDLDEKHLPRTVLRLAWPVVLQEAAWTTLSMIIMFFIGHLGAESIAAVGLSEQVIFIPMTAFMGIGIGATAIIARHVGAKEPEHANRILRQAMLMTFILGLTFALILWFFAEQLLGLFQARPEVIAIGKDYIRANAPGIFFFIIVIGGESIFRGAGDTKTPMIVIIVMEVIGTILAYILINGLLGAPALGVLGAGIARASASAIGGVLMLVILIRGKGILKYDLRSALAYDWTEIKRILRVGLPAFANSLQMRVAFSIYTIILSSLGTTVYAAHALAMRVEEFAFMPSFGFGIAATALVGQSLGAKKPDLARKAGYLIQRYCLITMVTLGVIIFILSRQLIGIFVDDPEVIRIGAMGLRIWAFALPGMAINNTLAGGLRGAGDTRWVFLLTTIGMWLMRVGGGALMVLVLNLGAPGAWIGAALDYNVRALLMWWRFAGGKWQTIEV
jgi:putative MATE family efflux protein